MKPIQQLHKLGQSLWLDNISRDLLDNGTLQRYIDELSVTGLTSNPTIFDQAIAHTRAYDDRLRDSAAPGGSDEAQFLELALDDLRRAADLLYPIFDASAGRDGWVSMEVSPLLANDTEATIAAALQIFQQARRPNLLVKIPGTPAGLLAIEESIVNGVPINVTLLFSREQYLAAAEAYLRGIERRLGTGNHPLVASVASVFVSRWDRAVNDAVPPELRNRLGISMAASVYQAYRELLTTPRWQKLAAAGAFPQRLLWASTGVKDATASPILYVEALAVPDTINTMPEQTLLALAEGQQLGGSMISKGMDINATLSRFKQAGVDIEALAVRLQSEGAQAFVKSWIDLLALVADKRSTVVDHSKMTK